MNFLLLNLIIALLFTTITTLSVGLLILKKSWNNKANRYYAFTNLSVAWWVIFQIFAITANSPDSAIFFDRLLIAGVWMIPAFQAKSVYYLLNLKRKKLFVNIGLALGVISAIMSFTPYEFSSVEAIAFIKYWYTPGIMHFISSFIFLIYSSFILFEYFKEYRNSSGARHNQFAYIFWSTLFGYAGGATNFFYGYGLYVPFVNPFATYLVGLYPVIVAYAILKHQLLDIRMVIKRSLVYSVTIALISGAIFGVSFLNSWFAKHIFGFKFWMIPLSSGFFAFIIGRVFWEKSKEVDKLKYEFITVATHKLRTPLTEIKWAAAELRNKDIGAADREKLIAEIINADNKLIELTNELLAVSKSETAQHRYNFEEANLEKAARNVVNSFQYQFRDKGIKLKYNFEKNLPLVNIDKIRISSVIQVLMENAVIYTKNEIKINIDVYKNNIIFHIEDNGIGIEKEDQGHIFSKFYRTHEAYLSETEGTGVGLFLAKSIVEKHGGKIGVRSEGKGKGSVFWFSLPAL